MQTILHIDMDAFYAAVELLDHPELKGRPLVVGSPPDKRGVVSTASYEARKFGVHSAMPSRTAYRLCPQAVFLPVRMERYLEVSDRVMEIIDRFTPLVEQVSVDEAFLDVRGALRKWPSPEHLARALKEAIRAELGLTASVGVAPNKFLAKVASDLHKPDGLTVVPQEPDAILRFLAPLPVSRIWGVGEKTEDRLRVFNVRGVADVQRLGEQALACMVGENLAHHMWELAHGRDDRPVVTEYEAKSISSESTFDEDCSEADVVRATLVEAAEHVGRRLRRSGQRARVGHLKLRFADFRTVTRQARFPRATQADQDLIRCATTLLEKERVREPVRLVGFGVSGFAAEDEPAGQIYLFQEFAEGPPARSGRVDAAVDAIRDRFGPAALRRGVSVKKRERPPAS